MFKVNKDGFITDVQARGLHPKLEEETIRVIKKIPRMQPGKQRGKAVKVGYSVPINFRVN